MGKSRTIGILGVGTIAAALVERIASDGHDIIISTRSTTNAARLAAQFENLLVAENQAVVDASDIVFLGMTADAAPGCLEQLAFRSGQQVISLMAELSFQAVAGLVAPATMTARMIPFPSVATEGSPILTYGNSTVIEELLGAGNTLFVLDNEAELETYLRAQAVLSPAVSMIKDASDWLAQRGSDPNTAEAFLRTLVGTSLLRSSCAELLRSLDTPGGYNQRLRQHMLDAGTGKSLHCGLDRLLD